jgi:hypothetical protein
MNSEEIHQFVVEYNWDDGVERIADLLDNPNTVRGTALMVFWCLEGPWTLFRDDPGEIHPERQLVDLLHDRLTSGFYPEGNLTYDAVEARGLSKVQVYRFTKAGLPPNLFRSK